MNLEELAQFKLPTAAELEAAAPEGFQQWASLKTKFSWEAIERFIACRSVGISIMQSSSAAGISRDCWYEWKKEEFGWWFVDLAEQWRGYGAAVYAARVAALTNNSDPNIAGTNARWLTERISEDHAPAPKREVVTAQADEHGARIVIEHMDGIVQPPGTEESNGE